MSQSRQVKASNVTPKVDNLEDHKGLFHNQGSSTWAMSHPTWIVWITNDYITTNADQRGQCRTQRA
jgi:cephalosporin-C deacetylase-like acetyl esterase